MYKLSFLMQAALVASFLVGCSEQPSPFSKVKMIDDREICVKTASLIGPQYNELGELTSDAISVVTPGGKMFSVSFSSESDRPRSTVSRQREARYQAKREEEISKNGFSRDPVNNRFFNVRGGTANQTLYLYKSGKFNFDAKGPEKSDWFYLNSVAECRTSVGSNSFCSVRYWLDDWQLETSMSYPELVHYDQLEEVIRTQYFLPVSQCDTNS